MPVQLHADNDILMKHVAFIKLWTDLKVPYLVCGINYTHCNRLINF